MYFNQARKDAAVRIWEGNSFKKGYVVFYSKDSARREWVVDEINEVLGTAKISLSATQSQTGVEMRCECRISELNLNVEKTLDRYGPEYEEVRTEKLGLEHFPEFDAPWDHIWLFAKASLRFVDQSIAGDLANQVSSHYHKTGKYPTDLHTLRVCLFFEWRRYRHFGHHPDGDSEKYVRGIVQAMRNLFTRA